MILSFLAPPTSLLHDYTWSLRIYLSVSNELLKASSRSCLDGHCNAKPWKVDWKEDICWPHTSLLNDTPMPSTMHIRHDRNHRHKTFATMHTPACVMSQESSPMTSWSYLEHGVQHGKTHACMDSWCHWVGQERWIRPCTDKQLCYKYLCRMIYIQQPVTCPKFLALLNSNRPNKERWCQRELGVDKRCLHNSAMDHMYYILLKRYYVCSFIYLFDYAIYKACTLQLLLSYLGVVLISILVKPK